MKKVCSLDFLNMQYFETDLKTADGRTVIQAGSRVTPELILKLYFKDIYSEDSIQIQSPTPVAMTMPEFKNTELNNQPKPVDVSIGIEPQVSNVDLKVPKASLPDMAEKAPVAPSFEIPEKEPLISQTDSNPPKEPLTSINIDSTGPKAPEIDLDNHSSQQSLPDVSSLSSGSAPKPALPDMNEIPSTAGPKQPLPDIDGVSQASGPKQALPDIEEKTSKSGPVPSSKFLDLDDEIEPSKPKEKKPYSSSFIEKEPEPEPIEINPVLKFDEQQAQRMAKLAIDLGKLLKFSGKELDDLRDAALYCNKGVISFRKDDTKKRDFEVHKALESAQMASIEGKISDRAIETIRLHPNDYDSASFSLNQKIPHYHIIGIVYYYEKVFKKEGSKMAVLDRMLQLGGNKFNIFVLHKFINMMKDINE